MTQQELDKRLDLHELWLRSGGEEGKILSLPCENLSGLDFSEGDLRHANLRHADLSYVDLSCANLSYADLRHANLRHADLSYADLSYADLSYADPSCADLSCADPSCAKGLIKWISQSKRECYSVGYTDHIMHKIGCFWGTTEEAKKAIRKKYGTDSEYESQLMEAVNKLT